MFFKKICFIIFAATIFWGTQAKAQDRGFGLGIIGGEPSGVSAKFWFSERFAVAGAFGISLGGDRLGSGVGSNWNRFHVHADALYHIYNFLGLPEKIPFYAGIGFRDNFSGGYGASFGIRSVAGLDWMLPSKRIDVFIELAPVAQFGFHDGFAIEGGLGARYFF